MLGQEKELRYTIKITGVTGEADRVLEATAKKADAIATAATRAKAQLAGIQGGGSIGTSTPWMGGVTVGAGGAAPMWTQPTQPPPSGSYPPLPILTPEKKAEAVAVAKAEAAKAAAGGGGGGGAMSFAGGAGTIPQMAAQSVMNNPNFTGNFNDRIRAAMEAQRLANEQIKANSPAMEKKKEEQGLMAATGELKTSFLKVAGIAGTVVAALAHIPRVVNSYGALNANMQSQSWRQRNDAFLDSVPIFGGIAKTYANGVFDLAERNQVGAERYYQMQDEVGMHPVEMAMKQNEIRYKREMEAIDQLRFDANQHSRWDAVYAPEKARLMFAPDADEVMPRFNAPRVRFDKNDGYDAQIRGAELAKLDARQNLREADERAKRASGLVPTADDLAGRKATFGAAFQRANQLDMNDDPDNMTRRQWVLAHAEKAKADYLAGLEDQKQKMQASLPVRYAAIDAYGGVLNRETDVMRAKLGVVNSKIGTAENSQVEFATSDWQAQQLLFDSVRQAKTKGFDSLHPEMKQVLLGSGTTSEWARDLAKADGSKNEVLKEIQTLIGQQDAETLKKEKRKLEGDIEAKVVATAKTLADLKKQVEDSLGTIEMEIKITNDRELRMGMMARKVTAGQP